MLDRGDPVPVNVRGAGTRLPLDGPCTVLPPGPPQRRDNDPSREGREDMHRGWFGVHRKIFDSDVWGHPIARIVWIFILGNVTHTPVKLSARYQCVTLQPAQMLTSQGAIAAKCRLSRQETRSALRYLISTNRITIESTKQFTIITITNWPAYRDSILGINQEVNQQNHHQVTKSQPRANHIQEDFKKFNSDKKDLPRPPALEGAAAPCSEEPTPEEREATRKILQEGIDRLTNKVSERPSPSKEKGNGEPVGEGKSPESIFISTLSPEKKKALILAGAKFSTGATPLEDILVELQVDEFTEEELVGAEGIITRGATG